MTLPPTRLKREFSRFLKFSVVGVIGAVVDFGTFNLLSVLLRVPFLIAGSLSFIAAVTSNFFWNRYWTYPDSRSKPLGRQAMQFALVNLVGLAIRTPVMAFAERPLVRLTVSLLEQAEAFAPLLPAAVQLGRNLALATAVVIVLFWNFGVNRLWTYSDAR